MHGKLLLVLALSFGLSSVAVGQDPRVRDGRGADRPRSSGSSVERWTDRLADEIEHLEEDLHFERGEHPRGLTRAADEASRAVAHFQEVLRRTRDQDHLMRDFEEMDRQVHQLVNRLDRADDSWLARHARRIRYADEQLHYLIRRDRDDGDGGGSGGFRELLARHAHVLEQESRQLARLVDRLSQRGREGDDLSRAIRDFANQAEHFHQVVERGADAEHLDRDFRGVKNAWRRATREINESAYGVYLRRVAQRTNQVHNQIDDMLDRRRPEDRRDRHVEEQPQIQFNIPGIGRFQLR